MIVSGHLLSIARSNNAALIWGLVCVVNKISDWQQWVSLGMPVNGQQLWVARHHCQLAINHQHLPTTTSGVLRQYLVYGTILKPDSFRTGSLKDGVNREETPSFSAKESTFLWKTDLKNLFAQANRSLSSPRPPLVCNAWEWTISPHPGHQSKHTTHPRDGSVCLWWWWWWWGWVGWNFVPRAVRPLPAKGNVLWYRNGREGGREEGKGGEGSGGGAMPKGCCCHLMS